jgi:hypothetical protein
MGARALQPGVPDLYERDYFEWTIRQAELLRAGRFEELDIDHVAEEIEDMGRSQRRQLGSRLTVLLTHLLKWQAQPSRRGSSWETTVQVQRVKLQKLLREMPSLRGKLREERADAYEVAVLLAAKETRLPRSNFPTPCPFTLEQLLDDAFFPE